MLYSKTLRPGMRGGEVKDLQLRLNHHHFKCVGSFDGHYGSRTTLAVVRFQDAFGIAQDGKTGPKTQGKLLKGGQVSPHFNIFGDTLYSRGNGDLILRGELIYRLELTRKYLGDGNRPMKVTSCFRDLWYNLRVGGAIFSQHKYGKAADVVVAGYSPAAVASAGRKAGFRFILVYRGFTHLDIR